MVGQPFGGDTTLKIDPLCEWQECVLALAYTYDDRLIGAVPVSEQVE